MSINGFSIILTIINIVILLLIVGGICIGIKSYMNFIKRNKAMDKKMDDIMDKLENKEKE